MSQVTFTLDTRVYRLTAIKKAAYKFGDRCSAIIRIAGEHEAEVTLTSTNHRPEELAADFRTEALDQELREVVAEETRDVRTLLMAQAFSPVSLLDAEGETANFEADPLGIHRPDNSK